MKTVSITAIHQCSNGGVYVEKDGVWYRVCENTHHFAEIANWSADYWERHRQDPPCNPSWLANGGLKTARR